MLVSPSIISSNLLHLSDEIEECQKAGIYSFHIDVMDGHFVPNLTLGPDFVKTMRGFTKTKLESHLMVERPDRYYSVFHDAGSSTILVHLESPVNTGRLIREMEKNSIQYGIVVNPETDLKKAFPFIENAEILLIMSVHPGFSGQSFIESTVGKIVDARRYIDDAGLKTKIEVDGGINDSTGKLVANAGADILVSASYIFSGNIAERISTLNSIKPE